MQNFTGDMLTRIRNGNLAKTASVLMHPRLPKLPVEVLKIIKKEGYIRSFT